MTANASSSSAEFTFTLLKSTRVPRDAFDTDDLRSLSAFTFAAEHARGPIELSLDLTGHARIQQMNRHFRGVDRTTDVISFRNDLETPAATGRRERILQGDIAINVQQAALQAKKVRNSLKREVRLLLIHGILHLLGYTDYQPVPRRRMFKRQNALLRRWESVTGR
jgi:probable rRNA maturation factor